MRKCNKRYKVTIEDESHLTEIAVRRFSRTGLWLIGAAFLLISILLGALIVGLTPIRTLLPGYLKESQRSATEEGLMRLDSLMRVYEKTQAFIDNYIMVTDVNRTPSDSASIAFDSRELLQDSLNGPSPRERKFVSQMDERERFSISVLAPLAADGLQFSPVTTDGVIAANTRDTEAPVIILPLDENVQSTADGTVIALYHSAASRGYVMIIQHERGFLTAYNGVGTPLASIGDRVNSGQIIAMSPGPDAKGRRSFSLRMWHNGLALKPYDFIGRTTRSDNNMGESFEAPRGK